MRPRKGKGGRKCSLRQKRDGDIIREGETSETHGMISFKRIKKLASTTFTDQKKEGKVAGQERKK